MQEMAEVKDATKQKKGGAKGGSKSPVLNAQKGSIEGEAGADVPNIVIEDPHSVLQVHFGVRLLRIASGSATGV